MSRQPPVTFSPIEYDTVLMRGGWDQSTPTLELYPGTLINVSNFEVIDVQGGGYGRIAGYERYDGRPSPSDATYTVLQLTSFTNIPTVGQTLTGFTSGATSIILAVTSTYLVVTKVSTTYSNTEVVKVGATVIGTLTPLTTVLTPLVSAQYTALAADNYRSDIVVVPGTGAIRGVVGATIGGVDMVYAFRNNAGGTAVDLYKKSAAGWVPVPFYNELTFTACGAAAPVEGNIITQGANTATIKRVMHGGTPGVAEGTYAANNATGRFVVTTPAPGAFAAGAATITGGINVTLGGAVTAITMAVGGKFEFDIGNFTGSTSTIRIYGCDGVNRGFEFDGDTLAPISTNATVALDKPTHVKIHKLQLFFAFTSSAIHSGAGYPFKWSAAAGASEIGCGDDITNFLNQPGTTTTATLGITTRSNTWMLYGSTPTVGASQWNLVGFNVGIGGIAFSAQLLNESYWMDASGVVDLRTTQNYGNFKQATITSKIQDYMLDQRSKVQYSYVVRSKNSYRILFTDSDCLYMTIVNGKLAGATRAAYRDAMYCAWSSTLSNLNERVLVGATTTGYVYEMDKGSSFDGGIIEAFITFNWNSAKSPRAHKRYRRASVEVSSNQYAAFTFGYGIGYSRASLLQPITALYETGLSHIPYWDSFLWDAFVWDGVTLIPSDVRVSGTAENIQTTISSTTNYIYPYIINSVIYHFSKRRGIR